MQNTLNDGLFTVSGDSEPPRNPLYEFVFPVPRSPDSEIAKSAGRGSGEIRREPRSFGSRRTDKSPAQPAHCPFEIHQTREQNLAMALETLLMDLVGNR